MANPWDNDPIVGADAQPAGLLAPGNIDLSRRPIVRNPDGSISTVRSISANFDGREVLLPTVSDDGRIMSDQEAIDTYLRTGRNLGAFDTPEHATAYAQNLHSQQERQYAPQPQPVAPWEADPVVGPAPSVPRQEGSFLSNLLSGFGKGVGDAVLGAQQVAADTQTQTGLGAAMAAPFYAGAAAVRGENPLVGALKGLYGTAKESYDLRQEEAQRRAEYAPLMGTAGGVIGSIAGNVAATAPLGAISVAPRGANAARAIGQAAVGGGLQSLLQPITSDDERLQNAALGAALGGGLSALGRGAMRVAEEVFPPNVTARALNFFTGRANQQPFAQEGEALAQRTGINLTPGMVSGSRAQTGAENMARQSLFSADTAFKADEKIANQAIDYVNRVMDRISSDSVSPQAIGERIQGTVRKAIDQIAQSREETAARQFGAIRRIVGDAPVVDYANTKQALQGIIDDYADVVGADAAKIRTQAQSLLNEIAQKPGYSLDAARRARGAYGRAARGSENIFENVSPDVNRRIAARLYGAMSDDLDAAGSKLDESLGFGSNAVVPNGVQAVRPSELLRQANDDYRRHSDLLKAVEMSPLRRLLGDQIDVDGFMTVNTLPPETVISRLGAMKPSELGMVKDFMERNAPDAWQQYKRLLVEDALASAQSAPASAGAHTLPFNATGFIRALGGDKPDKVERLKQIYAPGEMDQLMDAMQAARRMGDKFGANFSGTGPYTEVMQALKDFSVKGLSTTAATATGFNRIARMMANSDGRRALIELSKLPPGSKRANDLVTYLATVSAVSTNNDEPLEIDITGGRRESEVAQER